MVSSKSHDTRDTSARKQKWGRKTLMNKKALTQSYTQEHCSINRWLHVHLLSKLRKKASLTSTNLSEVYMKCIVTAFMQLKS